MDRVLWIAPNLNHYKVRFLNYLSKNGEVKLYVLAGAPMKDKGHGIDERNIFFSKITVQANKRNFHIHPTVYLTLIRLIFMKKFNVILMPIEKKFMPLIFFLFIIKKLLRFKLISYNHPLTRGGIFGLSLNKFVTKLFFRLYDRIIFYTRQGRDWALELNLIPADKALFANNTLDTNEIWKYYNFEVNESEKKVILFIGRLVSNKRLDLLLKYHQKLKKKLVGSRLIIIGDGPKAEEVKNFTKADDSICWKGAIINEAEIARYMRQAHLILIPGWSGLSIVHAFCYGKPYATIVGSHPPEIDYLIDGLNGLLLSGKIGEDCDRLASFLLDSESYEKLERIAIV